jgi:hypothetical protein
MTSRDFRRCRSKNRPVYVIGLRPEPEVDGIRALRALLKIALRRFGLRATAIKEIPSQTESQPDASGDYK